MAKVIQRLKSDAHTHILNAIFPPAKLGDILLKHPTKYNTQHIEGETSKTNISN